MTTGAVERRERQEDPGPSIFHVVANLTAEARQVMTTPPCKSDQTMTGTCLRLAGVQDGDRRTLCCSSACRTWEGLLGGSAPFIPVLSFYVLTWPDKVEEQANLSPVHSVFNRIQKNYLKNKYNNIEIAHLHVSTNNKKKLSEEIQKKTKIMTQ